MTWSRLWPQYFLQLLPLPYRWPHFWWPAPAQNPEGGRNAKTEHGKGMPGPNQHYLMIAEWLLPSHINPPVPYPKLTVVPSTYFIYQGFLTGHPVNYSPRYRGNLMELHIFIKAQVGEDKGVSGITQMVWKELGFEHGSFCHACSFTKHVFKGHM